MDGSADALIAHVQRRPHQPPKANRPHTDHRPWSVPDTSDYTMRMRGNDHGPITIDESPAINDTPSKLTPATQVPFTNERTNDQKTRATERLTTTVNDDDYETQRRLNHHRP
ncbi:hypothetical protein FPANT_3282 [Fusarium pseudoanthophilum]|uniref:Uncharacterized protein n=1 Tax=Fusarium pseudoanthophilum TaxID=48495 RepID=A0A8H5PM39_9HYPO|nr:hypothetical protein FPANT_3282 [Fusarium pseudoanthophilum]